MNRGREPGRRSVRRPGFDYQDGWFFVTICAHDRPCVFGEVVEGVMVLNDAGLIIRDDAENPSRSS
jgi:hypothetical protein